MAFRDFFPFFAHHPELIYADSAATSHKPDTVIEAIQQFLREDYATVHRSAYSLATTATQNYEAARIQIANLIGCDDARSIVYTKGATEALNLVSAGLHDSDMLEGDEILICASEHHANLVPWQRLAAYKNMTLRIMPMLENARLDVEASVAMITAKTAIVAIAHVSNALGNVHPIKRFIDKAKSYKALTIIDGTQAVPHMSVDVSALDCDFYVFSGHKMFGPTGIGVLFGKYALLDELQAYQLGGEMVQKVSYTSATFQSPPLKFEAGTPNISGVIGLAAAAKFIVENRLSIEHHEKALATKLFSTLSGIPELNLLGDFADNKSRLPIASFTCSGLHANDLAVLLNQHNVALRHGHHCAMPLMQLLEIEGTLRVSLAAYNTEYEISRLGEILKRCIHTLKTPYESEPIAEHRVENELSDLPLASQILASHSWDSMFRQIMLAGKTLSPLIPAQRTEENYVGGCEADVWLAIISQSPQTGHFYAAYSPSKIVRGLLAILLEKANSLVTKQEQQAFDYNTYLDEIGLTHYLSESRTSGLNAVINKIQSIRE